MRDCGRGMSPSACLIMGVCRLCGKESRLISSVIGFCADCIRSHPEDTLSEIAALREKVRKGFGLPPSPPKGGVRCSYCVNRCEIPEGGVGFCYRFTCKEGRITVNAPSSDLAFCSYYHDPLPTNCVASWVCPASTESGYPRFTFTRGPEVGYKNLAVFYQTCNFDCLYCQNWHFRDRKTHRYVSSRELVEAVDDRTTCVCFFGGDPVPNLSHSLDAVRKLGLSDKRVLRFCWETNGSGNWRYMEEALKFAEKSGGCVKFDLKFFDRNLNLAVCGADNCWTLENFEKAAVMALRRDNPPLVVASTLLVPGYVDLKEIEALAAFISSCNPNVPWSFLAFYPAFLLKDLPTTSWDHALKAKEIAYTYGIKNVNISNIHLLSHSYEVSA